ncbi:hypothetical protein JXA40_04335 [bacterium]|nr:hypothetical protein [candidate division CSSED10-310 bacterium]
MKSVQKCLWMGLAMLWVGSVAVADEPPTYTICEIQQSMEFGGSVFEGDRVRVIGICSVQTGRLKYQNTVINDPGGEEWSGIMIYDRDSRLDAVVGDEITAVGIVQEYYGMTEINTSDETEFPPVVTGSGTPVEPMERTTGEADQEKYESCLLRFRDVEVMSAPDQYWNIAIDDGSGEFTYLLSINEETPAIGFVYDCLAGVNHYYFEEFKLRSRDEADRRCPGGSPTATPDPNVTPTPTPPGGPCYPSLELYFIGHDPGQCFKAGDTFDARFRITHICPQERTIDLYIALEVVGNLFFWPSWSQSIDNARIHLRAEEQREESILPLFTWPSGVGSFYGLNFYGLMTEPDSWAVVGDMAMLTFCYN